MRKIIQIAIDPEDGEVPPVLYALCNDGTVWWTNPYSLHCPCAEWTRIKDIPQYQPTQPSDS